MSYHVTHWAGDVEAGTDFPTTRFGELLEELADADDEHPDVAVTHDSEWSLSASRSGFVVLEHLEEGDPVHIGPLGRAKTIALMVAVAQGRIDEVLSEDWQPGCSKRPSSD